MPGGFYIEGRRKDEDTQELAIIRNKITDLHHDVTNLQSAVSAIDTRVVTLASTLASVQGEVAFVHGRVADIEAKLDKLAGETPVQGSTIAAWQTAESDVVSIGGVGTRYKIHSLLLGISHLSGTVITVRLYMKVKEIERKVYEQVFDATADPPGLWIINGTLGIHAVLRVTLQSNNATDNGQTVDYDYMLETQHREEPPS